MISFSHGTCCSDIRLQVDRCTDASIGTFNMICLLWIVTTFCTMFYGSITDKHKYKESTNNRYNTSHHIFCPLLCESITYKHEYKETLNYRFNTTHHILCTSMFYGSITGNLVNTNTKKHRIIDSTHHITHYVPCFMDPSLVNTNTNNQRIIDTTHHITYSVPCSVNPSLVTTNTKTHRIID